MKPLCRQLVQYPLGFPSPFIELLHLFFRDRFFGLGVGDGGVEARHGGFFVVDHAVAQAPQVALFVCVGGSVSVFRVGPCKVVLACRLYRGKIRAIQGLHSGYTATACRTFPREGRLSASICSLAALPSSSFTSLSSRPSRNKSRNAP